MTTNLENAERAEMTPHAYAQEYEFRGDTDYTPSDFERTMIEDAILGYLGESRIRSCLLDKEIDELAYRFWSVHPKELDTWVENDPHPPMPEGYKGGVRAWFFACEIRKLLSAQDGLIQDLAMLVRQLIRQGERTGADRIYLNKARDFLKRKGLEGSPLRDAETQP